MGRHLIFRVIPTFKRTSIHSWLCVLTLLALRMESITLWTHGKLFYDPCLLWSSVVEGCSVGLNHLELMSNSTPGLVLCGVLWFEHVWNSWTIPNSWEIILWSLFPLDFSGSMMFCSHEKVVVTKYLSTPLYGHGSFYSRANGASSVTYNRSRTCTGNSSDHKTMLLCAAWVYSGRGRKREKRRRESYKTQLR